MNNENFGVSAPIVMHNNSNIMTASALPHTLAEILQHRAIMTRFMFDCIPAYLRHPSVRRWMLWRGKKVPYYANGMPRGTRLDMAGNVVKFKLDSFEDISNLVSFEEAFAVFNKGGYTGLTFALGLDVDGLYWQAFDFDHVEDKPWLSSLILPDCYKEASQSRSGGHGIGKGRKFKTLADNKSGIEAWCEKRHIICVGWGGVLFTGRPDLDAPICIADFVEQGLTPLHTLHARKGKNVTTRIAPPASTDGVVSPSSPIIPTGNPIVFERVRYALFNCLLDHAITRDEWLAMRLRLKSLGEDGWKLFSEWSATSAKHKTEWHVANPKNTIKEHRKAWDEDIAERTDHNVIINMAVKQASIEGNNTAVAQLMDGVFGADVLSEVARTQPVMSQHPVPIPLPELPSVLPFDYLCLPDVLRPFVEDIAHRMQCPADFPAVAVYVMLATVVGRKIGIRPKKMDDWTVTLNLWGAVVGSSGVKKSPALKNSLAALKKLEAKAHDEFDKAMSAYDAQIELAKIQQSVNKSEVRKALKNKKATEATELLKSNEVSVMPLRKRYSTNDASYEALGELMIENPNGILMLADELIGILKRLDTAGQEPARAFFLAAANGDQSYTFDRILRGKALHIEAACLSILGGIQPGVLADYVRQAIDGGAGSDGLLQRFGLLVYPDISPNYEYIDTMPQVWAQHKVNELIATLDQLDSSTIGAELDAHGSNNIPFLRFDDAAQALFAEWDTALGIRLRTGEEHPALVSHFSKYPKLLLTIALLNHLCDQAYGAVSLSALQRALAYVKYLESHARRIYSFATRPEIDAAKTLLKRLNNGKLLTPFTARDVSQKCWAGLSTSSKAQAAINVLLEYGHLSEEKPNTGGRPTTLYHWNTGE